MKKLLGQLVKINSTFPNEKQLALFLEKYLKKIGFKTKRQLVAKNRFNLLAEKGKGKKAILFYGHLDTVGICQGWKTNPFSLCQKQDKLFSLGARDMKSGIVAILKAVESINNNGLKVKIAFCVDEENISQGAFKLITSAWLKDVGLVVSADSGDIFKESKLPFRYILGRRGRCVISVEIPGKSVHGAFPQKGINAIDEASRFILALTKLRQPKHKDLASSSLFVRKIDCQSLGLSLADKTLLEIDKQLVPPEDPKKSLALISSFSRKLYNRGILKPELKKRFKAYLKPRKTAYLKPFIQDKDNKLIKMIDKIIYQKYGLVDHNYGLSVADDNIFYHYLTVPVVCLGVKGGNPHQANEWVSFKSMRELVTIYELLLKQILLKLL